MKTKTEVYLIHSENKNIDILRPVSHAFIYLNLQKRGVS